MCGRHWPELLEDKDSRRPPDNDAWRETHFTGVSTPVASTQEAEVQVLLTIARIGKAGPRRARQSYDLQLTRSVTSAVGSAWEREPWAAVQRAAWESLRKREAEAV